MRKRRSLWFLGVLALVAVGASTAGAVTRQLYIASTDGYVYMPDGRRVWIRGFVDDAAQLPAAQMVGKATLPGPIIDVTQGDDVFIHFRNVGNMVATAPPDPHSIHLHGIVSTTQNDGFPETSWEVPVPAPGGVPMSVTYYMLAEKPGSYMYHCHVEASEHIQMGMYGALIIRPAGFNPAAPTAYGGSFNDNYDAGKEYIVLLGEVDVAWHTSVEKGLRGFNPVNFKPSYWLINGRSFPDSIAPVSANVGPSALGAGPPQGWLTGANNFTTYAGLIDIPGFSGAAIDPATAPRVLLRVISMAYQFVPWHVHGWHVTQVGHDAEPSALPQETHYTVASFSGSTDDYIITAVGRSVGQYATNSTSNQGTQNLLMPAVGNLGANLDVQWYPCHSHHDYQVTNNGIYPGGALALIYAHP